MLAHVNTQACIVLMLTVSNADMLYYAYSCRQKSAYSNDPASAET